MKTRTAIVIGLALAFAPALVSAGDTYTFTEEDGVWADPDNWYSETGEDYPGIGDTAIIPDDTHCHVSTQTAYCQMVRVFAGGTLTLENSYSLHVRSSAAPTTSMIAGEVHIKDGAVFNIAPGGVTLDTGESPGNALINASYADDLGPGSLGLCCAEQATLTVGSGITVKGNVLVYCDLVNNGTFTVDDPNDVMRVNQASNHNRPRVFDGAGSFVVQDGTLEFDDCYLDHECAIPWILSGGTIHVADECRVGDVSHVNTSIPITMTGGELWVEQIAWPMALGFRTAGAFDMSGGTLDVDGHFKVTGGAELSGGRIEVAPDKWAELRY
jgi:hypothetical protein